LYNVELTGRICQKMEQIRTVSHIWRHSSGIT
jgi:hypothetical protein